MCIASLAAQDKCSKFYPITESASYVHTLYDNDNNELGKVTYSVNAIRVNSADYTVKIEAMGFSRESKYRINCYDTGVSMYPISTGLAGARSGSATTTGDNIYLPNELEVGETLDDVEMNIRAGSANMTRIMKDRKVLRQETITTPVDTFEDCYVLEYFVEMGIGPGMTMKTKTLQWLKEGVGVVRTEEYNFNESTGDYMLENISELTSRTN
ncbi:MAG: hypothetical protein HKN90_08960 [Flavobacteriaceae bacterium]|nr:hypothetical protein [Flavobacteriaceae bacterium]